MNATIASLDGQEEPQTGLVENVSRQPSVQSAGPTPTKFRATILKFPRRWLEDFRNESAIKQSTIVLGVLASLWGAITYYETWLIHPLQYLHIIRPTSEVTAEKSRSTVFLECNYGTSPRVFPPSGRYYVTEILPGLINEKVSMSLGYMFGPPGVAALPPDVMKPAYECKLTNYGSLPLFNVVVPMRVTFQEAHHPENQPNAWQSGVIKAVKAASITIAKIDAGKDDPFVFYFESQNPDFVEIDFMESLSLQEGSDQNIKTGRLIVAANSTIRFSPNETFQSKKP